MANERLIETMQEAIDGQLSEEQHAQLFEILNEDEAANEEYVRLQTVDDLLRAASHERAPERLAVTILARLSQSLEQQAELQDLPEEAQQALMLTMSIVVMLTLPAVFAASWMILNANADPALLTQVMNQVLALLAIFVEALAMLIDYIEELLQEDPEIATFAMSLIPIMLNGMLESLEETYYAA